MESLILESLNFNVGTPSLYAYFTTIFKKISIEESSLTEHIKLYCFYYLILLIANECEFNYTYDSIVCAVILYVIDNYLPIINTFSNYTSF